MRETKKDFYRSCEKCRRDCRCRTTLRQCQAPCPECAFDCGCRRAAKSEPGKTTLLGPGGIRLVLDPSQIFPDDPGNGTPAMVFAPFGRGSSTYFCAVDNGFLDGGERGDIELTPAQMRWLDDHEAAVDEMYEDDDKRRKGEK